MQLRLLEADYGESVLARTNGLQAYREVGPPDLVHLSKTSPKTPNKNSGTFHFVTGADTSSSAAVAAYLNTVMFSLGETQLWFGKHPQWKVHTGLYCCYDLFSRVDVRVTVKIPGSVESYVVDDKGDKKPATDAIWNQAFMSTMIRSLVLADDESLNYIAYWRRLNPLQQPEVAAKFYDVFESLFFRGPLIGAKPEVQAPNISNNYLVDAFVKFVNVTGTFDAAIGVLSRLAKLDPDVLGISARIMLQNNEEVRAVQTMYTGVTNNPRDYTLLEQQSDYCIKKEKLDWALDSAIRAVNSAPSEFAPWAKLVQIYTKLGNYEQALLSLNSCPMTTSREHDLPKFTNPAKVHFPFPTDGVMEELWAVNAVNPTGINNDDTLASDPGYFRLPALTLRHTFSIAYELLTEIVRSIGWDALLKYRSNVFLMEGEYRKEKRTRAENGGIEKPVASTSVTPGGDDKEDAIINDSSTENPVNEVDKMKTKRLCERWLDNLFMVLYEDLRMYTVWQAEYLHYKSQQLPYNKTAAEWEALGLVSLRLRHEAEAIEALQRSLEMKFSPRVLWKLLEFYKQSTSNVSAKHSNSSINTSSLLDAIVKLYSWNHRWYIEFSPTLILALKSLVAKEGGTKVKSWIEARYGPQNIVAFMDKELDLLQKWGASGMEA